MAPRFSILLPTHDRADVVGYAIRSVLAQSVEDWELLVVGDGCTDDTAAVVVSFGDDRIRWFDLPKAPGFGYANRNVALREARGELIAFMGHDDLWFGDHLQRMVAPFERREVEWAYSRPLWIDDDGTVIPFAIDLRRPVELFQFLHKGNSVPATCVVHRRNCLERYGYWSEKRMKAGDWELWTRMVGPSRGANLAYVPTPTCLHFRAKQKTGFNWGPVPLSSWLRAAHAGWWPTGLRLEVPTGVMAQASVWDELQEGGEAWLVRIRDAAVSAIDGFAWDAGVGQPRLERRLVTSGWVLVRSEMYREAVELADAASAVVPASAAMAAIMATASLGLGDHAAAEAAGRRAIKLDPTLVRGYRVLSRALAGRGRIDEAIEVARAGVAVGPQNAGLHAQLGGLLLQGGDIDGADLAVREAERLEPGSAATKRLREQITRQRSGNR